MAPAGAANGDGQITFALGLEQRQERRQVIGQTCQKPIERRVSPDVGGDARIATVEAANHRVVMRIDEKAHVEH